MMTGLLRSKKIFINEKKIRKALKVVDPVAHQRRTTTAGRSINPRVYKADYFGHKVR